MIHKKGACFVSRRWTDLDLETGKDDIDAHGQPAPYEQRLAILAAAPSPSEDEQRELFMLRVRRCLFLAMPVSNGITTSKCGNTTWYIDWEQWSADLPKEQIAPGTIDEPGRLSHVSWKHGPRPRAWRTEIDGEVIRACLSDSWR